MYIHTYINAFFPCRQRGVDGARDLEKSTCVCVCVHLCVHTHAHTYIRIHDDMTTYISYVLFFLFFYPPPSLSSSQQERSSWSEELAEKQTVAS